MPNEVSGLPVYSSKSDPWESYGHVHETGSLSIPCSQCQWVCLRAGGNRIPFTPNPGFCQQPFFQNPLGKPSKSPGTAKKAWRDSGSTGTRRNIIVRCQFIPKGLQLGLIKGDLLLALSVFNNALLDLEYAGSVSLWKTFLEIGPDLCSCIGVYNAVGKFWIDGIKDPGQDHVVATSPKRVLHIRWRRWLDGPIDEANFVLRAETNTHGATPSSIVVSV